MNKGSLSDSRKRQNPKWLERLRIIDSATTSLFSDLLLKGVGRHPKTGKKKGGIKVHTSIYANEGVPSDVRFTSSATNDSFMLKPADYVQDDIPAIDRAYVDYAKSEELTGREAVYVTKMKEDLAYEAGDDTMLMTQDGRMGYRIRHVVFTRKVKGVDGIVHHARIITCVDVKKTRARPIQLLTNDMDMDAEDIVAIYRKRWEIELLFKQLKQNFPLRYFYGESANAIKIQVRVTLIANLLLMAIQKRVKSPRSFSGLATMVRIMLMYCVNLCTFLEGSEKDWAKLLEEQENPPPQLSLFE